MVQSSWHSTLLSHELTVEETICSNTHTKTYVFLALSSRTRVTIVMFHVCASHCPQPAALRQWLFPKQTPLTDYMASNGSRQPQMQTWLLLWLECKTKWEQPHRYCWHIWHLSLYTWNDLEVYSTVMCLFCVPQGSKGLSLFYAEVSRDENGRLRGIEVQRLKDKLGTRQMPTAELLLDSLPAYRVSCTHRGIVRCTNDKLFVCRSSQRLSYNQDHKQLCLLYSKDSGVSFPVEKFTVIWFTSPP